MSVATYVAGICERLDNLCQLQMSDELNGHLLLKQANLEQSERTMIVASAKGNYKITAIVDSMRHVLATARIYQLLVNLFTRKTAQNQKNASAISIKRKIIWKRIAGRNGSPSDTQVRKQLKKLIVVLMVRYMSAFCLLKRRCPRTQGLLIQVQFIRL
jgi:hypothetical protein